MLLILHLSLLLSYLCQDLSKYRQFNKTISILFYSSNLSFLVFTHFYQKVFLYKQQQYYHKNIYELMLKYNLNIFEINYIHVYLLENISELNIIQKYDLAELYSFLFLLLILLTLFSQQTYLQISIYPSYLLLFHMKHDYLLLFVLIFVNFI